MVITSLLLLLTGNTISNHSIIEEIYLYEHMKGFNHNLEHDKGLANIVSKVIVIEVGQVMFYVVFSGNKCKR